MDNPKRLTVVDWQDSPQTVIDSVRGSRVLPPALIGVLGTILLHALIIQSVSFGNRSPRTKPPELQESAQTRSKPTVAADNLVLISLPVIAHTNLAGGESPISALPDMSKMKIQTPIDVDPPEFLNLETLALSEDRGSDANAGEADGAELARLFGIYTGQIQARVDRVWRRPRTPIDEELASNKAADATESFQCEAQIVQDSRGNVQEILLPRCNGSNAWQRSLVVAIQQASPLPAPPSVKVFTQSITLTFVGLPYTQGAPNEEYEIVPLARADR